MIVGIHACDPVIIDIEDTSRLWDDTCMYGILRLLCKTFKNVDALTRLV